MDMENKDKKEPEKVNDVIKKDIKKLKMSGALYLVDEKTKALTEAIGKKLYKTSAAIYWTNIVVFVLLCIGTFLFAVSPLLYWIFGGKGGEAQAKFFKTVVAIGIPFTVVTALYGGLVFWVLMTRVRQFYQNNHRVFVYMGVTTTIVCIDDKIMTYIKNGYLMDPNVTCFFKIDKDEICRFSMPGKYKFSIDFNWYSQKSYERFEEHISYYANKKEAK